MPLKLRSLRTPIDLAGRWVPSRKLPGVEFLVRSIASPGYATARDKAAMALSLKYRDEPVPGDEGVALMGALLAEHILLDWRGFDEPYSAETARELLADPEFRTLADEVTEAATRLAQPTLDFLEVAGKN